MELQNNFIDEQGIYVGSLPIGQEEFPPQNAIRCVLPRKDGYWPVANAARDGFDLVEDHRGQEGWVNGEYTLITELGSLPEGWNATAPIPTDTRTPEEKRRAAYVTEADPILAQADGYEAEAEILREDGEEAKAAAAEEKAQKLRRAYFEKKEEIRARYPDAKKP